MYPELAEALDYKSQALKLFGKLTIRLANDYHSFFQKFSNPCKQKATIYLHLKHRILTSKIYVWSNCVCYIHRRFYWTTKIHVSILPIVIISTFVSLKCNCTRIYTTKGHACPILMHCLPPLLYKKIFLSIIGLFYFSSGVVFRLRQENESKAAEARVKNPEVLRAELWVPHALPGPHWRDLLCGLPRGQGQHQGPDTQVRRGVIGVSLILVLG